MISIQGGAFLVTAYEGEGEIRTLVSLTEKTGAASGPVAMLEEMAQELRMAKRCIEAAMRERRAQEEKGGSDGVWMHPVSQGGM